MAKKRADPGGGVGSPPSDPHSPDISDDEPPVKKKKGRNTTEVSPIVLVNEMVTHFKTKFATGKPDKWAPKHRQWTVCCNLESMWAASDDLLDIVRDQVEVISRWKAEVTMFANWFILSLLNSPQHRLRLPVLSTPFFSLLGDAVTGRIYHKKSERTPEQDLVHRYLMRFAEKTGFQFISMDKLRSSQLLSYARGEMVTVAKNHIYLSFWTRRVSFLRWKCANVMRHLLQQDNLRRRKLLYHVVNIVQSGEDYGRLSGFVNDNQVVRELISVAERDQLLLQRLRARFMVHCVEDRMEQGSTVTIKAPLLPGASAVQIKTVPWPGFPDRRHTLVLSIGDETHEIYATAWDMESRSFQLETPWARGVVAKDTKMTLVQDAELAQHFFQDKGFPYMMTYANGLGSMDHLVYFHDSSQDIAGSEMTTMWDQFRDEMRKKRTPGQQHMDSEELEDQEDDGTKEEIPADRIEGWPFWKQLRFPRFSPMPFNRLGRHFVTFDKKAFLENIFPKMSTGDTIDDNEWWMCSFLDIYRRKSRSGDFYIDPEHPEHVAQPCKTPSYIPQFRQWRDLSSPAQVREAIALGDYFEAKHRPSIPGASFSTDGVSVHISVLTVECDSPHVNLKGIGQKGYDGIPRDAEVDINQTATGITWLESCVGDVRAIPNANFPGVDTGVIKVVAATSTDRLPRDPYSEPERQNVVTSLLQNGRDYSQERLMDRSGRKKSAVHEQQRRAAPSSYKESLDLLACHNKKTFDLEEMTAYCAVRVQVDPWRIPELLSIKRSYMRRERFVKMQRTVHEIAHKVVLGQGNRRQRQRSRWRGIPERRHVVFFGSALFVGAKGHGRMPRKAILRVLATLALVVLLDEWCSSKLCSYDFKELRDAASEGSERIRVCPTLTAGGVSHIRADRDVVGSTNLCQKGVYYLLGRRLAPLFRQIVV